MGRTIRAVIITGALLLSVGSSALAGGPAFTPDDPGGQSSNMVFGTPQGVEVGGLNGGVVGSRQPVRTGGLNGGVVGSRSGADSLRAGGRGGIFGDPVIAGRKPGVGVGCYPFCSSS